MTKVLFLLYQCVIMYFTRVQYLYGQQLHTDYTQTFKATIEIDVIQFKTFQGLIRTFERILINRFATKFTCNLTFDTTKVQINKP